MAFPTKIKKFIDDQLDKGDYILHGDDIMITINPKAIDDKYLYQDGDGWRVLVPHKDDPDNKESLGSYPVKGKARKVRDEWIARDNALHSIKANKKLEKVFRGGTSKED